MQIGPLLPLSSSDMIQVERGRDFFKSDVFLSDAVWRECGVQIGDCAACPSAGRDMHKSTVLNNSSRSNFTTSVYGF
jgi:hypothetical protein